MHKKYTLLIRDLFMEINNTYTRPATIKDVAKLANVSISTVSRVINNKGGVSVKLQTRIEKAINQLRFHTNGVARALRINATKTIGFIVPSVENPTFGTLAKTIESVSSQYGFSTILCNTEGDVEKEVQYLHLLHRQQVDGIIFNAMGLYDERFSNMLNLGIPIVVVGRKVPGFPTPNVTTNNRQGANDAVSYMISKNIRRIAFIFGQFESVTAIEDRFNGYRDALAENNIPFVNELVINTTPSFDSGAVAVQWLIDNQISFNGIFASNDLIALSCIQQLEKSGLKIPSDVSVMGYDMIPFSQIWYPKLSTVNSNITAMAGEAVRVIVDLINKKEDIQPETILQAELVLGGTTP